MSLTSTVPANDSPPPNNKKHFTVSVTAGIIFIVILSGVFGVVYLIDDILPTPLKIEDENDYPESFIAERAQQHLKKLTFIGPRITGSYESEVLAVELLKSEIDKIQNQAHPNQKIEFDVQVVSGSFTEDASSNMKAYGNVQNVIVKLHSRHGTEDSLLVNVHFDTVPISQGGSDDGINCATVLEILRKLSQLPEGPLHNIIFLFNGAEEAPILASHGFITQHAWAERVQVFINLEASGAGGKIILFQVGPKHPWLLKYYSGVPHPYAQTIGEEIFQAGIIPSDTDFKIFRDYGKAIGFDFAFIKDAYRYHTSYDRFGNIPGGSYQHVGDNILYLIKAVANAHELGIWKEPSIRVFYDYMGLFLISYSETVATVLNCITAVLSILVAIKSFYNFHLGN